MIMMLRKMRGTVVLMIALVSIPAFGRGWNQ
jgi:hypothetical protein